MMQGWAEKGDKTFFVYCLSLKPIVPAFRCAKIPIVPARHRSRSGEAGGSEAN